MRRSSDAVNAFPVGNHKALFAEKFQSDYVAEENIKKGNFFSLGNEQLTLNLSLFLRKSVTRKWFACIFTPFQLEYETMTVETPRIIEL
jgi:hypothetical protein